LRRKPLTGIDPLKIFLHAQGFHLAEHHLSNIDIKNTRLALEVAQATMALSALNSELFLKCLICLETGSVPAGHYLDELFDQLSAETKQRIEEIWVSEIVPLRDPIWKQLETAKDEKPIDRSFRAAILEGRKAFEEIRYSYEPGSLGSRYYIGDLPRLLWLVILEKKPEWRRVTRKISEVPLPKSDSIQK
jgi:hypothetical protein